MSAQSSSPGPSPGALRAYLKAQNIQFSFRRLAIQGLGGMAQGLFASLLIGTILGTLGTFLPGAPGVFLQDLSAYTKAAQGSAMAAAIGVGLEAPPYVLFSLITVGLAANSLGGAAGGPLAVYAVALVATFFGKLVSKRTPVDLIVTPAVSICAGLLAAQVLAPPIGAASMWLGDLIVWATNLHPFLMGILISVLVGVILTLPISSAAICASFGLVGLAGGAAVAGCCAQMVGFAVCSYRENRVGGLASIGLGTSMLLIPNLLKKPILWLPPTLSAAITGPIATMVFSLRMNGSPISSGMGTCGLVGPIGIITGWFAPGERALEVGEAAIQPGFMEWLGLFLVCLVLPALLSLLFSELMRKKGWIQPGDYLLT